MMGTLLSETVVRVAMTTLLLYAGPLAAQQPRAAGPVRTVPAPRYTQAELRSIGQAYVSSLVARYGVVRDTALDRVLRGIIGRLQGNSGHPELQLTFAVVNDSELNAQAAPGGFMVINAGLLRFFSGEARREAPNDPARQAALFTAYLAAVLAHELAHVTLGHTDAIVEQARRLVGGPRGPAPTDARSYEQAFSLNDYAGLTQMQTLGHVRDAETAADRTGALYLLRSGWAIEDAAAVMRKFDALERGSDAFYSVRATSYLRSHPRASEREAELVMLRAQLMHHQRRFDDAVSLIDANVELDLAIALLDSVLVDFPDLLAARHARGTAYARKWLNTVPLQLLKVRPSLPTYSAHFSPGIRGAPGDTVLLNRALADYARVLSQEELPLTLSSAAVLDAYIGNAARAERMARRAVELLPQSTAVLNNLGVVLFLAGRYTDARTSFERAVAEAQPPDPAYVFNLGRTLRELRDPGATPMLRRFLASDDRSAWRQEAAALLGESGGAPQRAAAGGGGAALPTIAGLTLGATRDEVVTALGRPAGITQGDAGAVWQYPARSLVFVVSDRDGVVAILMTGRGAGAIDGVAVGDGTSAARGRWGEPSAAQGAAWFFARSSEWGVLLRQSGDLIGLLGIGIVQ